MFVFTLVGDGGIGVLVAVGGIAVGVLVKIGVGVLVDISRGVVRKAWVAVEVGMLTVGADIVLSTSKIAVKVKFGVANAKGVGAEIPGKLQAKVTSKIKIRGMPELNFFLYILPSPPRQEQ